MLLHWHGSALALLAFLVQSHAFDIVRDYSGESFFDKWDFYGNWDNLTLGDVWWLNATDAMSTGLASVNEAGHAIMKVDNTTNIPSMPLNQKRNSVRITSQDFYDYGSLWIIDLLHIPYGCSVWPAFWAKGSLWPNDGEIDIIEAINNMDHNQMALHTTTGCVHNASIPQLGANTNLDCGTGAGCVVAETQPNSYNSGFAAAGGGVWATQFDVSGIYIWFWSRPNVPSSITQANSTSSIDISQWGLPSASYPATDQCNLTSFFTAQQLVFDITLCGDWAGVPGIYNSDATCVNSGTTGTCYGNNVVGPGSPTYDNAYFEVSYVRAYTTSTAQATSSGTGATPTTTGSAEISPSHTQISSGSSPTTLNGDASNDSVALASPSFAIFTFFIFIPLILL